jgi:curved DNA-binding protein CbpA
LDFPLDVDYYEILGVDTEVDDKVLRQAYKQLAIALHPDKFVDKPPVERESAQQRFSQVSAAYNVLKDPALRKDYDFQRRMVKGIDLSDAVEAMVGPSREELAARKESAERQYRIGYTRFSEKDFKAAIEPFKQSIKLNPEAVDPHVMLGLAYQKLGWLSLAKGELQAALKLDPKHVLSSRMLAEITQQEQAQLQAAEEAEEAASGKKKRKKAKGGKKAEVAEAKAEPARPRAVSQGTRFKKKRQGSFFQNLLSGLFGRKG